MSTSSWKIETPNLTVAIEGETATAFDAIWMFEQALKQLGEAGLLVKRERMGFEAGSTLIAEGASEALHDRLPGGWAT